MKVIPTVRMARVVASTALLMVGWAALVGHGVLAGWWHSAFAPRGDVPAFMAAARRMLSTEPHGDVALAVVTRGQVVDEHYSGVAAPVDRETVFPVASLSKWVTAALVMELARQHKLDLDAPVTRYLTRWKLPPSRYELDGVTVRRLLSHTAGLTDGLGFGDYRLDEPLPSLEASLRAPRASSGRPTAIRVEAEPGSRWQYSGGGYLVLQLVVEEVSKQPFATLMRTTLFEPLGMTCSSFEPARSSRVAGAYDAAGRPAERFQYAAAAATGLSTCVRDMVRWVEAQARARKVAPLAADTVARMRAPHGRQLGADIWGLGTMLYAPTEGGAFVFGHDGDNAPAINAAVRIDPDDGDALVILTSGGHHLATRLASEWTYWQTGGPDFLVIGQALREAVVPLLSGWLALVVLAVAYVRLRRRAAR